MTQMTDAPFRLSAAPTRTDLLAKYFRGLGEPVRLAILALLRDGEHSVNEIASRLEIDQTSASKHLACLRWCGYVTTRREHRTVYNRIADDRVAALIDLADAVLDDNAEHVAACRRIER